MKNFKIYWPLAISYILLRQLWSFDQTTIYSIRWPQGWYIVLTRIKLYVLINKYITLGIGCISACITTHFNHPPNENQTTTPTLNAKRIPISYQDNVWCVYAIGFTWLVVWLYLCVHKHTCLLTYIHMVTHEMAQHFIRILTSQLNKPLTIYNTENASRRQWNSNALRAPLNRCYTQIHYNDTYNQHD